MRAVIRKKEGERGREPSTRFVGTPQRLEVQRIGLVAHLLPIGPPGGVRVRWLAAGRLEPYLGALGHLVALREGRLAYLHIHPLPAQVHGLRFTRCSRARAATGSPCSSATGEDTHSALHHGGLTLTPSNKGGWERNHGSLCYLAPTTIFMVIASACGDYSERRNPVHPSSGSYTEHLYPSAACDGAVPGNLALWHVVLGSGHRLPALIF